MALLTIPWRFIFLKYALLLHFYLQMLNIINVKNSWDSLRCKYQLKQIDD